MTRHGRTPEPLAQQVRAVIEPAVAGCGLVLEDVTVTPAGSRRVVRVVVDLPDDAVGSLPLDDVAAASRAVDAALEADSHVLGATPYVLEVGTPGTSRPLTTRRHWSRARTRLVTVPVAGGVLTGRVVEVNDAGVVLQIDGTDRVVPWTDLGTGRLELEFRRPGDDEDTDDEDTDTDDEDDEHDEEGH